MRPSTPDATQTAPAVAASARGTFPTGMRCTTLFALGSTCTTSRLSLSATHSDPPPYATAAGAPPTVIRTASSRSRSIRDTVPSAGVGDPDRSAAVRRGARATADRDLLRDPPAVGVDQPDVVLADSGNPSGSRTRMTPNAVMPASSRTAAATSSRRFGGRGERPPARRSKAWGSRAAGRARGSARAARAVRRRAPHRPPPRARRARRGRPRAPPTAARLGRGRACAARAGARATGSPRRARRARRSPRRAGPPQGPRRSRSRWPAAAAHRGGGSRRRRTVRRQGRPAARRATAPAPRAAATPPAAVRRARRPRRRPGAAARTPGRG